MYASKLTQKYQATIPAEIRKKLGLKRGDLVAFEFVKGQVVLRRVDAFDLAFSKAVEDTLEEWTSEIDEKAYGGL